MLNLIVGGSASGKSMFAENLVTAFPHSERFYIATMEIWDTESAERAERHRLMRAGKGFTTLECPTCLDDVSVTRGSSVLLEDLSNLAANEIFSGGGSVNGDECAEAALVRIRAGLEKLLVNADMLTVVSNELFLDGISYDAEMEVYLTVMSRLNRAIAARADNVYELICGLPVVWKGQKFNAEIQ